MFAIIKRNPMAAVIAVLMHVAILLFMIVGVDWLVPPKPPRSDVQVVQARVVDPERVAAEMARLKRAEEQRKQTLRQEEERLQALKRKQAEAQQRLQRLEQERKAEEQKRHQREAAREAEEKRLKAAEEQRRKAEQQRVAEEKRRKVAAAKRKKAEEQRAAEQKRRKAEAAKKRAAAEKKKKAAAERKRKAEAKRRAEEKKRKAAEAKKRKAEQARRRAEAARKAREAELQAAARAEREGREIDRYTTLIKQKVVRKWLRPPGAAEGLKCRLQVRLGAGGQVLAVNVLRSSGNPAFDRSAAAAVYKADPLPVPAGSLFEKFRSINFEFDPNR